ncbi:MAG: putative inorganic carbon transporter subunit DabA, partial [Jatrophihabitantaceae bacterium]
MPEDPSATLDRRRARLRSDVSLAARVLPTHYPLTTFIAVNPLDGLRHLPFHAAAQRAGELYGARATLPEAAYRRYHAQGRITDLDLEAVLTRRYPRILDQPPLPLGGRAVELLSVLRADLQHGQPAPDPVRVYRTISEQAAPAVADRVDALASRWCAAFLTADDTAWPMPGRRDGFYPAWRDLAHRDHTLTRAARAALRALPARAEDAALTALRTLGVAEGA